MGGKVTALAVERANETKQQPQGESYLRTYTLSKRQKREYYQTPSTWSIIGFIIALPRQWEDQILSLRVKHLKSADAIPAHFPSWIRPLMAPISPRSYDTLQTATMSLRFILMVCLYATTIIADTPDPFASVPVEWHCAKRNGTLIPCLAIA